MTEPISEKFSEADSKQMFWSVYQLQDDAKPNWRLAISISFVAGFILVGAVLVQNITWVIQAICP